MNVANQPLSFYRYQVLIARCSRVTATMKFCSWTPTNSSVDFFVRDARYFAEENRFFGIQRASGLGELNLWELYIETTWYISNELAVMFNILIY